MAHRPRSTPRTTRLYELAKRRNQGASSEAPGKPKPHFFGTLSEYLFLCFLREKTVAVEKPGETAHAMQNRQRIAHFSSETICCTVTILGVSRDSGHGLGSDGMASLALFSLYQERFLERSREGVLDPKSGQK